MGAPGCQRLGGLIPPADLLQYQRQPQPTDPMTKSIGTRLSACQARSAIYDLADLYSWETVAAELIANLSGDEAREFVEDFRRNYGEG